MGNPWPSLRARELLTLLMNELGYRIVRQSGSHRRLEADGRPPLTFAFHDRVTVPPRTVRRILVTDIGLTQDEALEVIKRG